MTVENSKLINDLLAIITSSLTSAQRLKELNVSQLNYKKHPASWSALECIEHLNLYGDFYLPEIEKQILKQSPDSGKRIFKSGLLGNYFANLMQARNGKIKKMKSPKDKNPSGSNLTVLTIDRFIKQLEKLQSLLNQSATIDLTKTKTAISLTNFIRLRLGDTFRFFTYHIERHVKQAEGAISG